MDEAENHTVPVETHESWRTWLMTGARRTPVDRRRMRGDHKGLKKILLEGLTSNEQTTRRWQDFSGAMVRHAVDDAMRALPPEDTQVVKLAYFGGYSNREIAREVGLAEGTVQRRLRRALAAISDSIQGGRAAGRRVLYGLGVILAGRWLSEQGQQLLTATAVAGTAAVIIVTHPAAPASAPAGVPGSAPAHATVPAQSVVPPAPSPTAPAGLSAPATVTAPVAVPAVQTPAVNLPVALPTPALPTPSLPPLPVKK